MSDSDSVDGSTVLFKATPIHEGPLYGYHGDPQNNFRSATYNVAKTDKEITLYRLFGGEKAKKEGSWWTPIKPEAFGKNSLDSRIDYAVLESWPNTMENCAEIRVPADTLLFTGFAGEQSSKYNEYKHGGKCQVFLPREIVKELLEYNKTGDTSPLHSSQKEFIKNWEQRNFVITNNNGKTLHTNPAQFEKLLNSAKSLIVPDLSKTNTNTFKQAGIPQRLNTIIYQSPTNEIRETRKFTQQSVKSTFINNNGIPRNQCYISSPWPGGIELVESLPIFQNQIINSTKIENPKVSIEDSSFCILAGNEKHQIQNFEISSIPENLPPLSPEEIKGLFDVCKKSTKTGIMISLELYDDRIDTITDGFDPNHYPQIYETIKEADAILGNLIFGTNLFQSAVEENTKIELTNSEVSTYQNPCNLELQFLKSKDIENLEAQKDAINFGFIGPHPKFVINKNANLFIKDDKLVCDGCPLDIKLRGVYLDFYGNTYYDDDGKRCYKNHAFINDFRKNFQKYFEAYPVLKKVATYAIFVAATLNDKITNVEKIDYQKISKTPRQGSISNGVEEIEIQILEAKEELFRQKPPNPLAWNLFGNEWCKHDAIKARSFYFEALLEIHFSETLMNVKRKIETDYYKKHIVKNACLGILTSSFYGSDENKRFTDGEKRILCKMFATENDADDIDIKLALIGIAVNLILNLELWTDLKLIDNFLWRILADEEVKHKSEETMPTLEESWNTVLSSHDWSKIPDGLQLSNLLTNISHCFYDLEKKERILKTNSKKYYFKLLELLTSMNNGGSGLTWLTKKIGNIFLKAKENVENHSDAILALSAMGYQLLPYLWILNRDTESIQHQKILSELYLQISFFFRSLSAMFYIIKNDVMKNKLEWIVIAKDCLSEFLVYIDLGASRTNALEIEKGFERITKNMKTSFPTNISERKEAIEITLSELFELRTLAISGEDHGVAGDLAEAIATIYSLSHEPHNAALWNETAKIDRKKLEQEIST